LVFEKNIGSHLSLDEVAISNGELYTILTNKTAKGKKGSIVATREGTKSKDITGVFLKIPLKERRKVKEVTADFSPRMNLSIRNTFPNAKVVTDRFHVQKLVTESLQEIRITLRWQAIKEENKAVKKARKKNKKHQLKTYENGDTKKQLLARSRYLLFKPKSKWRESQEARAVILFREFPELEEGYRLSMMFRGCYEQSQTRDEAKQRLDKWYLKVQEKEFDAFVTTAEYLQSNEETILNYFPNRSTNASAESFNAKLKGFRALVRGVRDKSFFLFRVSKLYA